jgi:hypothetical protein
VNAFTRSSVRSAVKVWFFRIQRFRDAVSVLDPGRGRSENRLPLIPQGVIPRTRAAVTSIFPSTWNATAPDICFTRPP